MRRDEARALSERGSVLLRAVFDAHEAAALAVALEQAFSAAGEADGAIRREDRLLTAARNVVDLFPPCRDLWRKRAPLDLLIETLGENAGLVRALYFDKPPARTWALPWHQDLSIAVKERRSVAGFAKPTVKAGVPHFEAPAELLERMLFFRIHLDAMTDENGPLRVIPGSHLRGIGMNVGEDTAETIRCAAGDVLAIRPLVVHSSVASAPGCDSHRRILHLEFAADRALPDGLEWRWFVPLAA